MAEQEEKRIIVKVAYNYFQEGKWDRALDEYIKLVAIDPMDFLVHNMMAEIYSRQGKKQEAINEFLRSAGLLRATSNLEKAIQTYRNILKIDPNNEEANIRVNEIVRLRLNEIEEVAKTNSITHALELCEKLSFRLPDHPLVSEKIADLEKRIQLNERPSGNGTVSDGHSVKKDPGAAEQAEAVLKNAETVNNLLGLAEHYEKKEEWDEAVETYITLLRVQPENEVAQVKLRQLYRRVTQKDKSAEVLNRMADEKRDSIEQAKQLGKTQTKALGESSTAKFLVQAGLENGRESQGKNQEDMLRLRQQAEEKLRMAVQDRRDREKLKIASAPNILETSVQSVEPRQTELEREQNIQVLLTQAQMYVQQNMLIEAMRLAQNILELDSQNKDVRNILMQIYEKKRL